MQTQLGLVTGGPNNARFFWNQQDVEIKRVERELEKQYGPHSPEKPPPKEPGDQYILWGSIGGAVLGAALGFVLGVLVGLVVGSVIGGMAGALVGNQVKTHMRKRKRRAR